MEALPRRGLQFLASVCVILAFGGLCDAKLWAYRPDAPWQEDAYSRTHALVAAAYPTLGGHGLLFTMAADQWRPFDSLIAPLVNVVFTVGERQQGSSEIATVFRAHVGFTGDGSLYDFIANPDAPFMQHARLEALGRRITSHSEWSDDEVSKVIEDAGARFGPASSPW